MTLPPNVPDILLTAHERLLANLQMAKGFETLHLCVSELVRDDSTHPDQTKDYLPVLLFIAYKLSDLASNFSPEAERHDERFFDNLVNEGLLDLTRELTPDEEDRLTNNLAASWGAETGRANFWFPSQSEVAEVRLALHRGLLQQSLLIAVSAFEGYLKDITEAAIISNAAMKRRFYDDVRRTGDQKLVFRILDNGPAAYATFVSDLLGTPTPEAIDRHLQKLTGSCRKFCSAKDASNLEEILAYRHVIAHRAGIVDSDFKTKTGCSEAIGEPLRVTREFVKNAIELIGRLSSEVQREVESAVKSTG